MKVLQILPKLELGGVEKGVVDFASYFGKDMVVISGGGRLVKELKRWGVKHYRLPVYKKSFLTLFWIKKIRKIIREEKVEIVHARSRVPAWVAFFATRNTEIDFITTAHGKYTPHFFSRVMGWGKFVICPSKVIARHMIEKLGVPQEKIKIVPRWVNLSEFKFKDVREKLSFGEIFSIGRITPSKGYEYLIEAFRKVVRINPYLKLKIVGDCDSSKMYYFQYLKNLVVRYSLNYNVEFLGFRNDIPQLLERASLLVAPSIIEESFGRVVIEAFASGTPVIATKLGAFEEIIKDREEGILVPPKDVDALSAAILEVLNDYSLAEKITKNARKKVEESYNLHSCIRKIENIYQDTKRIKRILVLKFSSLGDLILIIPSLKSLRDYFPHAQIHLLTLKKYASIFSDCPYLDKVIAVDASYRKMKKIFRISSSLLKNSYDYIIDFQNNTYSHLIAFLSFPRKSFGYRRKWGFLLTHKIKEKKSDSPLTSQQRLLHLLGVELKDKTLTLWDQKEIDIKHLGVFSLDNLIGINVSASVRWETKNWPIEYINKLIKMLIKEFPQYRILLLGDKHSQSVAEKINVVEGKVLNLCGKTNLRELIYIIKHLHLLITGDTASLHIAVAQNIPTIAIFGPTSPFRHTESSKNLHILFKKLPCSFCYRERCKSKECMLSITPQEVFKKIKEIMDKHKR